MSTSWVTLAPSPLVTVTWATAEPAKPAAGVKSRVLSASSRVSVPAPADPLARLAAVTVRAVPELSVTRPVSGP
jgi:hypothetical protein